ncbi:MAG: PorT family protein [Bacteroidetes bacterium]|nr:PorT family protein [Bacteroidota bacterium]
MTAFRSGLLAITLLLSLTAVAQKDTIIINRGKTIDTLTNNQKDSFIFKTDKIVMGKTTILTKIDTVGGKQQKTVEISVSGEGLGEMIEKQIDFFTNRKKKPLKKVEGFDLFKTEKKKVLKNLENFWWVMDLGFSQYNDQSNYAAARTTGFVAPNIGKDQLKLNVAASRNVNLWILMQRVNLAKNILNLKYGIGLEMNNYRFEQGNIQFQKNPTAIYLGMVEYNKVKLAADYITVPMMLHLNTSPEKSNGLRLSAGVSAGFLYSSRFKTKERGDVDKLRSDFDLEPFKFSWVGEVGAGPITLYTSFAMNNMWNKGLDMRPYSVGIRLGARPEKAKTKTITATKKPSSFNWSERKL